MTRAFFFFIFILISSLSSHAHDNAPNGSDIAVLVKQTSVQYLWIAIAISSVFTLYAIKTYKHPHFTNTKKLISFLGIIIPVLLATVYLIVGTVYVNSISETNGPVHWHADFEVYACSEKIDLKDPTGLSNRIGTPVFHEHNDFRIHVEGVVVAKKNIDLHTFFSVVGGTLTESSITIPTNTGNVTFENGDVCNNEVGVLQVFLYKTKQGVVTQQKVSSFENYILSPYAQVPPGDCIIIEFGPEKQRTTHICESYRIALQQGDVRGS